MYADLHCHTTASDGELPPFEVVRLARDAGVDVLSVTDHDTVSAVGAAVEAAGLIGIRLLPGVELSADGPPGKCHLLGLGIDPACPALLGQLHMLSESRSYRNERIAARLRRLGIPVTLDDVIESAPRGANIGRPHFAALMVARGAVASIKEAFDRYLADNGPAYVERDGLTPATAVRVIQDAGGRAFLAHPGLVRLAQHETHATRLATLRELGLDGVEAYYSRHTPAQTDLFVRLAGQLDMVVCGGSDFHGPGLSDNRIGAVVDGKPLALSALGSWIHDALQGSSRTGTDAGTETRSDH